MNLSVQPGYSQEHEYGMTTKKVKTLRQKLLTLA